MENQSSKKFLCLEVSRISPEFGEKDSVKGNIIPSRPVLELCKCPANPEMLMAALQFLTDDMVITVRISDKPIDFVSNSYIK